MSIFKRALARLSEHSSRMRIVHEQPGIFWKHLYIISQRSGQTVPGKQSIGEEQQSRAGAATPDCSSHIFTIAMFKPEDGAIHTARGIYNRVMGFRVDYNV